MNDKRPVKSWRNSGNMLDSKKAPPKYRGGKFTFLSFLVVAGCLAVVKAINPDIPLRSPVIMLTSIALACGIMAYIAGRDR